MEKSFYRVRSTKDIIITVILVVAGCVLVLIPSPVSINITGFFMMFAGLILFFVLRTAYKDSDTIQPIANGSYIFLRVAGKMS